MASRPKTFNLPHLDAAENYFFARETEFISRELIKVEYVKGMTRTLLPIENEMDPTDDSYTFRVWDSFGAAKRVADDGSDVPQVGVAGTEINQRVDTYALGYNYTQDEIKKAARLGRPLESDRAMAVRDGIERKLNDVACDGDAAASLKGFLGLASVNTMTPSTKLAGGTAWLDANGLLVATPDEVIDEVNLAISKNWIDSKEIYRTTRVVMPTAQYAAISTKPRSALSDVTILNFLKTNNPGVEFLSWERLKYVDSTSSPNLTQDKDRMICYDPKKENLKLLLPVEFEQQAPQLVNYRYKVNCRMKCGGVISAKPKSILFVDGI